MNREENSLLDRATRALRDDTPESEAIAASVARSAQVLSIDVAGDELAGAIQNCEGVQQLFAVCHAGTLSQPRRLLVDAHLRDCGVCLQRFRHIKEGAALDWR